MNLANTKERILQYIDFKGIKVKKFYEETGIKRGFLDSDKLKSSVSDVFLAIIFANYPDVNPIWLITGEGEMLKNTGNISIGGDNKGIANTGVIAGDSNITINKEAPFKENNTEDINNLLDSYNTNKGVEIDRLQALYATMLESKDAIIEEKNLLIQELKETIQGLKEQIQELREDKKHLKSLLDKGND